ncbi:MAG: cobalt transporter [Alphaproteobacteria bacterium]|nr:cobalt transporter [Alphaproteobacteria bacterium]
MTGRVLLAVLLGGIAAGLIMGMIQHVRLTPLILAAEVYEQGGGHDHAADATAAATATETAAEPEEWAPTDGLERSFYTTAASMLTGAGFAIVLAGISLLVGLPLTAGNGAIWGLCGFLAVMLAPSAGLPPELPGMPAADLEARQIWWFATIAATAIAVFLVARRREAWPFAMILIVLPHVFGAPQPTSHETAVPAGLAALFAANSLAAGAIFWSLIGIFTGMALDRHGKGVRAA